MKSITLSMVVAEYEHISSWHCLAQSEQCKHQDSLWNLFKVNNTDTRTTAVTYGSDLNEWHGFFTLFKHYMLIVDTAYFLSALVFIMADDIWSGLLCCRNDALCCSEVEFLIINNFKVSFGSLWTRQRHFLLTTSCIKLKMIKHALKILRCRWSVLGKYLTAAVNYFFYMLLLHRIILKVCLAIFPV